MKGYLSLLLVGLGFGFALSRIGFSSWDEVHKMFAFRDLRLLFTFALATVLLTVAWLLIARYSKPTWQPRSLHPGSLIGGLIFGAGWALSGACPSIALVQLGEGQLAALLTLAGILLGNYFYSVLHERYFRWQTTTCADA
jgi:uncharacterized membrane protein YedE/YeeE